ncbi:EamA family transporter RarD [Shewanella sp. OPT22]|nr:EamA family transporter RarD [Shewanella sp. OPT22]
MRITEFDKGLLLALCAYTFWGLGPIFYTLGGQATATDLVFFRSLWLLLFLSLFSLKFFKQIKKVLDKPIIILMLLCTAILLVIDWTVFIWAVNHQKTLEVSLGYFMMPLMTSLLGVVFYKETLSRYQWVAIFLALVGVTIQASVFGYLPMFALITAVVSSLYPILRKAIKINVRLGLLIEAILLLPMLLMYAGWQLYSSHWQTFNYSFTTQMSFMILGILTAIPLICFTGAIVKIPVTVLGFLQYLSPSLMFCCGLFWQHEAITWDKVIAFAFIWLALILFSSELKLNGQETLA